MYFSHSREINAHREQFLTETIKHSLSFNRITTHQQMVIFL